MIKKFDKKSKVMFLNLTFVFRVLWLILCIGSTAFACYLCYPIVMKWINFPTITTILQSNFPVSEIPFPAVTICPNNKVFEEKLDEAIRDDNGP